MCMYGGGAVPRGGWGTVTWQLSPRRWWGTVFPGVGNEKRGGGGVPTHRFAQGYHTAGKEPVQSTPIGIQGYTINRKQVRSRNIVKTTKAHPWNIKRMPWWYHMVRIVCIVWLTAGEYDMTHHTGVVNSHIWSTGAAPKGDSRMRWNIQRRLVTLSNDMEYGQKTWNDSQWRIRMAHDVHPNPGPPTAPPPDELTYMTLNVGGPHISKKRWAGLLKEIEQQQPVCVGLQEVRFRSGSNHMALTSQVLHTYVPMYHRTQTADVMMLIQNRISPYVTMLPSRIPHAMAVRVELPGRLPLPSSIITADSQKRIGQSWMSGLRQSQKSVCSWGT